MKSPDWICKKNEITCHIKHLFQFYGEEMNYFDAYLQDVLQHDIDKSLYCFRNIVKQIEPFKPKEGSNGIRQQRQQTYQARRQL